jgi:large subunit ribosomal protein L31
MKKGIHPENYRPVIFLDTSSKERFLIASTIKTTGVAKWDDGKEYPLYEVEISSASHPFYTGKENMLDTAGRVQKFKTRAAQKTEPKAKKVKKTKEDKKAE